MDGRHPRRWSSKSLIHAVVAALGAALLIFAGTGTASAVTGAGFTSVNENVDGAGHCANGNPNVNCNIYDGKQYVWLNGGPSTAYVGDGSYFFAVLAPGGQADPNDGAANNLSDDVDTYANRTFSVTGGVVSYAGTHTFADNKIRLADYADTPNPGGVYIMAICALDGGYPVTPSSCKYDAFKVQAYPEVTYGQPLSISKDAAGAYTTTWTWSISKSVDKTVVKQVGGNATFTYTVGASHSDGTVSGVTVTGTITVFNPNVDGGGNAVPVDISGVSDTLSDGTVCDVANSGPQTLTQVETTFAYSCDLDALPQGELDNNASVAWDEQLLTDGNLLSGSSADFTFSDIAFDQTKVDDCAAVTDSYAGALGTVCAADPSPKNFTYSRTIPLPRYGCQSYDNTATFTTNTSGSTGSASQTVKVCGPANTGALTIGFWQNPNGQGIIKAANQPALAAFLKGYHPFSDLGTTASASYVTSVIKAASCTSSDKTCNSMLKAQMLATALNVYFSDPALGGNKIGAYSGLGGAQQPIGSFSVDLTKVCTMIDGSGGTATCTTLRDTSSAFGGSTPQTVAALLAYQNTSDPAVDAGKVWYGQVKATQVLAKDTFDAINNRVVFGP
jgi:hypothetical protein